MRRALQAICLTLIGSAANHRVIGGVADLDGPPARSTITAASDTVLKLPKASVTIIRGKIAAR